MEEPGGIKYLTECEVPTEEYNDARVADLVGRHPKLSAGVAEHIAALEPFLDTSILAGFSYGVNKAVVFAIEATLLGHKVNREGSAHDEEKTQAIVVCAAQGRDTGRAVHWVYQLGEKIPCPRVCNRGEAPRGVHEAES